MILTQKKYGTGGQLIKVDKIPKIRQDRTETILKWGLGCSLLISCIGLGIQFFAIIKYAKIYHVFS